MKIENNVCFAGRIKNPINSKNKLVRYSINQLKHHVGGNNVEHELTFNEKENYLMVFTRLFPNDKIRDLYSDVCSFNTIKRLDLVSKEKITEQAKELASWTKRTNKY